MEAGKFSSAIVLKTTKGEADCRNLLEIMGLGAESGEMVEFSFSGEDEDRAKAAFQKLVEDDLNLWRCRSK